jgi:hypothetical protein
LLAERPISGAAFASGAVQAQRVREQKKSPDTIAEAFPWKQIWNFERSALSVSRSGDQSTTIAMPTPQLR